MPSEQSEIQRNPSSQDWRLLQFLAGNRLSPADLLAIAPQLLREEDPAVRQRYYDSTLKRADPNSNYDRDALRTIGRSVWSSPHSPERMGEVADWLRRQEPKKQFPVTWGQDTNISAWKRIAEAKPEQDNPARSPAALRQWASSASVFIQEGSNTRSDTPKECSNDDALRVYVSTVLKSDAQGKEMLAPVMEVASDPSFVASVADERMLRLEPRNPRDYAWCRSNERNERQHAKLGDSFYRARFTGEPLSPSLAGHWLRRGLSAGVSIETLEFMSSSQPDLWKDLQRRPAALTEAISELVDATKPGTIGKMSAPDAAARVTWFFSKLGPSRRLNNHGFEEGTVAAMPIEVADALHDGCDNPFSQLTSSQLEHLSTGNLPLAKHLIKTGKVPPSLVAELLLDRGPFSHQVNAGLLDEVAGLKLPPDQKDSFDAAALLAKDRDSKKWLGQQGHTPGWSQLPYLFAIRTGFKGGMGLLAVEQVGSAAQQIAETPRPETESTAVAKALALSLAVQSGWRLLVNRTNALPYETVFCMRAARSAGIALTDDDLESLAAPTHPLNTGGADAQMRPGFALIAAELAEWAGPERSGAFVDKLPFAAEVRQVRAVNAAWQQRIGKPPPLPLLGKTCYGLRPATYEWAQAKLREEAAPQETMTPGVLGLDGNSFDGHVARGKYAYTLAVGFGTPDRIERYVQDHFITPKTSNVPYNTASQFEVPAKPGWPIAQWGDALLRYGPTMAKFVAHAEKDVAPPASIAIARTKYATRFFKGADAHPQLANLCMTLDLDQEDFDAARDAMLQIDPQKAGKEIPRLEIEGERFNMPGYRLRTADPGDPRIVLAGRLTDCCQHVTGAASEAAVHSATSPYGSCCFLEKKPDREGRQPSVVAASWLWLGQDQNSESVMCFDSWEPLGTEYNKQFPAILLALREEVKTNHPKIHRVTFGTGGGTPTLPLKTLAGAATIKPLAKDQGFPGYRDSRQQTDVFLRDPMRKHEDMEIAVALAAAARNAPELSVAK
jgi:hypothetical protein